MFILRSPLLIPRMLRTTLTHRKCSTEPILLKQEIKNKLILTLNRPKVLNCIGLPLSKELHQELRNVTKDHSLLILKGCGDKAFTSGGDLAEFELLVRTKRVVTACTFSANLTASIYLIHTLPIPVVALANGFIIGGGSGIATFSKYLIVTEKSLFFMPEIQVGYHPNSGSSYIFNKIQGKVGYYLGLTGNSLKGSDIVQAGLATHFCYSKNLGKLERELLDGNAKDVQYIIEKNCETKLPEFSLNPLLESINRCFSESSVENIITKLKEEESTWAEAIIKKWQTCSPKSLKVTLRLLQKAKNMELEDYLLTEVHLMRGFCRYPDLIEGAKPVLLDKNYVPKWNPATLEEVSEELIEDHFDPVYDNFEQMKADLAKLS